MQVTSHLTLLMFGEWRYCLLPTKLLLQHYPTTDNRQQTNRVQKITCKYVLKRYQNLRL